MTNKVVRKRWLALLLVLSFLFLVGLMARPERAAGRNQEVALVAPPFLPSTAPTGDPDIGEMLDEEAGISAWYDASGAIDLDQVRDEFRTIEIDTGTYIVGSVALPNYPEAFDVHVYVHQDGWILAYYLNDEPVSKIVDAKGWTLDTTSLKNVIAIVAGAAGYPVIAVNYYDFRYPSASNILFVAEDTYTAGGDSFTIEIPSTYAYFERSWIVADGFEYFSVDGIGNPNQLYHSSSVAYGTLTVAQLVPDVPHTILVGGSGPYSSYGVLVLVYWVP